eukprot:c6663_g1_i2 orf=123-401(-)
MPQQRTKYLESNNDSQTLQTSKLQVQVLPILPKVFADGHNDSNAKHTMANTDEIAKDAEENSAIHNVKNTGTACFEKQTAVIIELGLLNEKN